MTAVSNPVPLRIGKCLPSPLSLLTAGAGAGFSFGGAAAAARRRFFLRRRHSFDDGGRGGIRLRRLDEGRGCEQIRRADTRGGGLFSAAAAPASETMRRRQAAGGFNSK